MKNLYKSFRYFLTLAIFLSLVLMSTGCGKKKATPTPTTTAPTASPTEETGPAEIVLPYRDPTLPIEERVADLLGRMTLEEKIGQMTQVEKNSIKEQDITDKFIGSLLSGGGGYPARNTPEKWAEMVNGFQEYALQTRLGIPLIYGVDAVHGHNNVEGVTIFPHNIGLGAARDPDLMVRIGQATAAEVAATSVHWNFGPAVAVPQDIRWGRTYEGYSENTELVTTLAAAYIRGLQGDGLADPSTILATAKHFVGDGGTAWGTSTTDSYMLDQGDMQVDEATLRAMYLPPYQAAIENGALSIMVSFSSWNGTKMHAHKYLLTDVLKGELGFEGFLVSDWGGIDQIADNHYDSVVAAINAGVDMNMVPYDYDLFIFALTRAVEKGDVSMERIDDAVRRILRVKFKLGLFEHPFADESLLATVGSEEHRELAREAVQKSLVLLKNEDRALPIAQDTPVIFVAGVAADDIGTQCGGWTIEWQGAPGNITEGTTILDAIKATVSQDTFVQFNKFAKYNNITDDSGNPLIADVGIAVVGEKPYAEGVGDSADLALSEADVNLIERLRERSKKLVVILISGRPLIITAQLPLADAFVAAWLPGTEGQGVADVLFGAVPSTGKLPYTWPRTVEQIPFDFDHLGTGDDAPLFPFGYGLQTDAASNDWTLVWNDEFEGSAIDPTNWTLATGGWGWGNAEKQYYTDKPENARVEDGHLVIEAREESHSGSKYTSARLKTQGLQSWTYGKIEARIKIPSGQGIWPAFWMLGEDITSTKWPRCGEIDVMENIGNEPFTVYGTLHGPGYSGAHGVGGARESSGAAFADDFHTFAVEWEPDRISWYVDDGHYMTKTTSDVPGEWVYDHPFFIILNVAVGGYWPGYPDETTVFPQYMYVDWVRVYQR